MASSVSWLATTAAQAQGDIVTIQTVDGNVSIQGSIVSFDGSDYELDSLIGVMRIPANSVICLGDACPEIDDGRGLSAAVSVVDAPSLVLINNLVKTFASTKTWEYERSNAEELEPGEFSFTDDESEDAGVLTVSMTPSNEAYMALAKGEQQFLFSTAPIDDELAQELVDEGYSDLRAPGREVIVALDSILPIVHPDNPVRDISLPDIARIAAGRISNWSELGGPDLPIRMLLADDGSSVAEVLDERVMRPNRLRLDRRLERVTNEAEGAKLVYDDPAAISLASKALIGNTKPLPIRQVCGPLSFASDFSVKAEEYPLARRVILYTSGEELPQLVKEFISYSGSQVAQTGLRDIGFVGQNVEELPLSLHGSRLASAILYADTPEDFSKTRSLTELLAPAERLSTTFRFATGSRNLDNKSLRDAVRIAEFLQQPQNQNRNVLLFGFTDNLGRSDLNQLLSLQQANSVKEAIVNASNGAVSSDRITVTSYGSVAPVGCNDTVEGRNSNRRVEVWLR